MPLRSFVLFALVVAILSLTSCQQKARAPKSRTAKNQATQPAQRQPASDTAASPLVHVDGKGKKWVGDIPYDVFEDDPLASVSQSQPIVSNSGAAMPSTTPAGSTPSTPAPMQPTGSRPETKKSQAWEDVVTSEELLEEIKKIRNALTAHMKSVGSFNENVIEIRINSSLLAMYAGIAQHHPADFSWKKNAPVIRDLAAAVSAASEGPGRKNFDVAQKGLENLGGVFEGNVPPDVGEAQPDRPFSEFADRHMMMKRINKANEWLRGNINTEDKMKKEGAGIQSEARVLRLLGQVVAHESYSSSQETEYKTYVGDLMGGAQDMLTGEAEKDYTKFTQGLNRVQKACNQCHKDYFSGT